MKFVNYKGRPLTQSALQDLNALFALMEKNKPVPTELAERLYDEGVELPRLLSHQR